MLTGDAAAADPVCSKSPDHQKILEARRTNEQLEQQSEPEFIYRNDKNSRVFFKQ